MNTHPPTAFPAWQALAERAAAWRGGALKAALAADPTRARSLVAEAPGMRYDYSRQRLDAAVIAQLVELAAARELPAWRAALLAGEAVNDTEQRPAWHSALRAGAAAPAEVQAAQARMRALARRLREGAWRGATGRPIRHIVHLGTGGSDLGPRLVVDALAEAATPALRMRFASNVDPLDLERALRGAEPEATLCVVVSKTFTTQETMENARAAKAWLARGLPPGAALDAHFIAVSANVEAARSFGAGEVLPMWDWVGGRYSVWSAVGFTAMAAIGEAAFDEFLAGAADMDAHFAAAPLARNLPVLMALVGVWNVNFLDAATHAVLPYATRAAPAARVPAAARDGIQRQARRPRGTHGRLRDRAGAVGRRGHGRRSTPSTSCCTRARSRCPPISSSSTRRRATPRGARSSRHTPRRRPRRWRTGRTTRRCRLPALTRATGPRARCASSGSTHATSGA